MRGSPHPHTQLGQTNFSDASASFVCPFTSGRSGVQSKIMSQGVTEPIFRWEGLKSCHKGSPNRYSVYSEQNHVTRDHRTDIPLERLKKASTHSDTVKNTLTTHISRILAVLLHFFSDVKTSSCYIFSMMSKRPLVTFFSRFFLTPHACFILMSCN